MISRIPILITSLFTMGSALGADTPEATIGLTITTPALIIFAIAIAMLLALVFHSGSRQLSQALKMKINARRMRTILNSHSRDILAGLVMPGACGGLVRIDYAILTSGGILCIQCLHCDGIVFGGTDEPQWTNIHGLQRKRFLNPLIQNEGRVRALQEIAADVPIASLVVFAGDVQFRSPLRENVMHMKDLADYIGKSSFGPCKIKDWEALWLTVQSFAISSDTSH